MSDGFSNISAGLKLMQAKKSLALGVHAAFELDSSPITHHLVSEVEYG
jgi:hypothetical protein